MTVYARYDGRPLKTSDYITPGNMYEVEHESDENFCITDDAGETTICLWEKCAHLEGGSWTRVEIPDERDTTTMNDAEATVFCRVYNYERNHGSAPSQAARTAGWAVSVFKREVKGRDECESSLTTAAA